MRMAYLRKPDGKKRGSGSRKMPHVMTFTMPSTPGAPALPTGEDEASQLRHLKMLKSEMKKVNPKKQITRELMKRTFPTRRKAIMDGMGTVKEILLNYSALKYPDEVSMYK